MTQPIVEFLTQDLNSLRNEWTNDLVVKVVEGSIRAP